MTKKTDKNIKNNNNFIKFIILAIVFVIVFVGIALYFYHTTGAIDLDRSIKK